MLEGLGKSLPGVRRTSDSVPSEPHGKGIPPPHGTTEGTAHNSHHQLSFRRVEGLKEGSLMRIVKFGQLRWGKIVF